MKAIEDHEQLLIFRVGPVACCVSARDVDSIVNAQVLHKLPRQADFIAGVLQYRDTAVSIVNLFYKFSVNTPAEPNHGRFIMAYTHHGVTGFWVDEIVEITNDFEQDWSKAPAFSGDNIFDKTLLWHEKMVLQTDFDRLFSMKESQELNEWATKESINWESTKEDLKQKTQQTDDEIKRVNEAENNAEAIAAFNRQRALQGQSAFVQQAIQDTQEKDELNRRKQFTESEILINDLVTRGAALSQSVVSIVSSFDTEHNKNDASSDVDDNDESDRLESKVDESKSTVSLADVFDSIALEKNNAAFTNDLDDISLGFIEEENDDVTDFSHEKLHDEQSRSLTESPSDYQNIISSDVPISQDDVKTVIVDPKVKDFEQDVAAFFADKLYSQVAIYQQSVKKQQAKKLAPEVIGNNDLKETPKVENSEVPPIYDIKENLGETLCETFIIAEVDNKEEKTQDVHVTRMSIDEIKGVGESHKSKKITSDDGSDASSFSDYISDEIDEIEQYIVNNSEFEKSLTYQEYIDSNDLTGDKETFDSAAPQTEIKKQKAVKKVVDRINMNEEVGKNSPLRLVASVLLAATGIFLVEHYELLPDSRSVIKKIPEIVLLNEVKPIVTVFNDIRVERILFEIETVAEKFGLDASVAFHVFNDLKNQQANLGISQASLPAFNRADEKDVLSQSSSMDNLDERAVHTALSDNYVDHVPLEVFNFMTLNTATHLSQVMVDSSADVDRVSLNDVNHMSLISESVKGEKNENNEIHNIDLQVSNRKIKNLVKTEHLLKEGNNNENNSHAKNEFSEQTNAKVNASKPQSQKEIQKLLATQFGKHNVVRGDTLWAIAGVYLNNPFRYPDLARWSNIKNPDLIYPGNEVKYLTADSVFIKREKTNPPNLMP